MRHIAFERFKGERSLFASKDIALCDCVFSDGESPLKESRNVRLERCLFHWKYPLWYCKNVVLDKCSLFDTARAGIWYSSDISVNDSVIQAPKTFRRANNISLSDVYFSNAEETLWSCAGVTMKNVAAKGNYFAMNGSDIKAERLYLDGNYSFDGCRNVVIKDSRLLSKDAFWNCENVTVTDSFISGEYLGWNSKNVTFENCVIESLQGLCCIDGLKLVNCKLINTNLAFEHSSVEAEINGGVDSVFDPASGVISADSIGELISCGSDTKIICSDIKIHSEKPQWLR